MKEVKIRHIHNRLTIVYFTKDNSILYKISYCSFRDQFCRKVGVSIAQQNITREFVIRYKQERNDNKIIALILLNEVMQNLAPRKLNPFLIANAYHLGFSA